MDTTMWCVLVECGWLLWCVFQFMASVYRLYMQVRGMLVLLPVCMDGVQRKYVLRELKCRLRPACVVFGAGTGAQLFSSWCMFGKQSVLLWLTNMVLQIWPTCVQGVTDASHLLQISGVLQKLIFTFSCCSLD